MYPISYEADPALEGRNRLTTFFRYIVAIPWLIVASLYGFVAEIAAVIAWFAIVFTGKYPEGLYNFNAGLPADVEQGERLRVPAHRRVAALRRRGGARLPGPSRRPPAARQVQPLKTGLPAHRRDPGLPARDRSGDHPHVCALIAWFAILFTGKLPEGLFNPMRSASAYLDSGERLFPADHRGLAAVLLRGGGRPAARSAAACPARGVGADRSIRPTASARAALPRSRTGVVDARPVIRCLESAMPDARSQRGERSDLW